LLQYVLAPIHKDGWRFIAIFAVVTVILWWLWSPHGWLGLLATVW
jgi:phosphatidylserine decarboxylase